MSEGLCSYIMNTKPGKPFQTLQFLFPVFSSVTTSHLPSWTMNRWRQTLKLNYLFFSVLFSCPGADICVWQAKLFPDPYSTRSYTAGSSALSQSSWWHEGASCDHLPGALALSPWVQQWLVQAGYIWFLCMIFFFFPPSHVCIFKGNI